jgi:hypothetical protein
MPKIWFGDKLVLYMAGMKAISVIAQPISFPQLEKN